MKLNGDCSPHEIGKNISCTLSQMDEKQKNESIKLIQQHMFDVKQMMAPSSTYLRQKEKMKRLGLDIEGGGTNGEADRRQEDNGMAK